MLDDPVSALDYYLSAYFLDPHFYDSEYAEGRVRELSWSLGAGQVSALVGAGEDVTSLLANDNPRVVGAVLESLGQEWRAEATGVLYGLLAHDDTSVRWGAMTLLRDQAPDEVRAVLDGLLADKDFRKRGLAAYLSMRLGSPYQKEIVESMLFSEVQLLRYDAISALLMEGGAEGHALVLAHREREEHPSLIELLDTIPDEFEPASR